MNISVTERLLPQMMICFPRRADQKQSYYPLKHLQLRTPPEKVVLHRQKCQYPAFGFPFSAYEQFWYFSNLRLS